MFVVPGIERHFTGLPLPAWTVIFKDILVVVGFWIIFLALRENGHASSIIEVKSGQNVMPISPYARVRHPMYSGCVVFSWRRRLHTVGYGLCRLQSHWYSYWLFDCLTTGAI